MPSDAPLVVLQSFPRPRPTTNPYLVMLRDSLEALPGVGHYAPDQVPERVSALVLEHLARHPV